MKLKLKVLTGMLAVLTSVCTLIPSVGAMDNYQDDRRDSLHIYLAQKNPRLLYTDFVEMLLSKLETERWEDVVSFVNAKAASKGKGWVISALNTADDYDNTIWHVLVREHRWSTIRQLLTMDGSRTREFGDCVELFQDSFKEFLAKWDTRTVDSRTLTTLGVHLPADIKKSYPTLFLRWRS